MTLIFAQEMFKTFSTIESDIDECCPPSYVEETEAKNRRPEAEEAPGT